MLLAILGGVLTWQHWPEGSVFDRFSTAQSFGVVVGIEVVVAGLGAAVLSCMRRSELTPAWIALVVGIHFIPLASLLKYPLLYVVAGGVVAMAVAAAPVARSRQVALSAVIGVGTGSALLAAALFSLVTVLR